MLPNFELMLNGLQAALQFNNIVMIIIGTIIGIIFGALPGLSASMAVALMIPVTFGMEATTGILLLVSAYCGAMFGGSISAILVNIPGTVAAAATTIDGYPLSQQGRGGEALGIAAFASFIGGTISVLALLFLGPLISSFAIYFGAAEYTTLGILGLVLIISVSMDSLVKGLISGTIGLLIGTIGQDAFFAFPRFCFNNPQLYSGIALIPAIIGLFAIAQVFFLTTEAIHGKKKLVAKVSDKLMLNIKQIKNILPASLQGGFIGTLIGALPGAGASIATFLSYEISKRSSKYPEKYGTGLPEGVAAVESANNGVTGGAFITMLTLGIPGNGTTAVMMGGLMILGIIPGPNFFTDSSDFAYSFTMGFFIANLIMLVLGLSLSIYISKLVLAPTSLIITSILVLSVVGAYATNYNMFDVEVMFFFGIVGYIMKKLGFSAVPMLLGMILGPIIEANMIRALMASRWNWSIFFTRPLSLSFITITVLAVLLSTKQHKKIIKKSIPS